MSEWMQPFCYATSFACFLFAAALFRTRAANPTPPRLLGAFFAVYAVQAALLGIILAEGRPLIPAIVRPSMAMTVGPLLFLYFDSAADPAFRLRPVHGLHFIPALVVAFELIARLFPVNVDLAIIASFGAYAAALGWRAWAGAAQFAHLGARAKTAWRWLTAAAVLMGFSFIGEILIDADIARTGALDKSMALFLFQVASFLIAGVVILMALQRPSPLEWIYAFGDGVLAGGRAETLTDEECKTYIGAFETLTERERFYAEDGATLAAAAKRLNVPARKLSEAINRAYGESYSRRMNRLRVAEAKCLIDADPDVSMTAVMFDAGFRTKSSFNREFRAFEGIAPSDYRNASRREDAPNGV